MKNYYVTHFLPRWANGGMERVVIDIIKNSNKNNFSYSIVVGNYEEDFAKEELAEMGVNLYALNHFGKYSFVDVTRRLMIYLRHNKCDIIHIHINNSIGLFLAKIAKINGIRTVVVHSHNSAFGEGNLFLKKIIRKISLLFFSETPDLLFACSRDAAKWTYGKRTNECSVIYNGVDASKFVFNETYRKQLRKIYCLDGKYVIGHVGHFNYQKNQSFIIDLIDGLRTQIPNVHILLIGTGEKRSEIEKRIIKEKIETIVTIIDPVEDIYKYYSMMDLFVMPSNFEGFGIVVVEAQFNGLRVIASDKVPHDTAVSDKIKYLPINNKNSHEEWNTEIFSASRTVESRTNGINIKNFDEKCISAKIEEWYLDVLNNTGRN